MFFFFLFFLFSEHKARLLAVRRQRDMIALVAVWIAIEGEEEREWRARMARSCRSLVEAGPGVKMSDGKSGPMPGIRVGSRMGRSS